MNSREIRQRRREQLRQMAILETKYAPVIKKVLDKQIRSFLSYADNMGLQGAASLLEQLIRVDDLLPVMSRLYKVEGKKAAKREQNRLNAQYGKEYDETFRQEKALDFLTDWLDELANFFNITGFTQVVRITETTRDYLRQQAERGVREQLTIPQLRDLLITEDINKSRANVIARTEVITVLNNAAQTAAKASRIQYIKQWVSILDKRTRHTHTNMDGEQQALEAPYSNGGMFPGDPSLPAKERIRCRCSEIYIAQRDERGRLVRK